MSEEGSGEIPLPQIRFVSVLPFAPPLPVLEFPTPEKVEQVAIQLLQMKNVPEVVQMLKEGRG